MLFHSPAFAVFLACFLAGLPLFRDRARVVYTALCSYVFYAWWYPPYLPLLLGMTVLGHFGALLVERDPARLPWAVAVTLAPLAFVKYSIFALHNVGALVGLDLPTATPWHLPLGLSFITFTLIAYLVDVGRGRYVAEHRIDYTGLYVAFFPHLIAGPILRPRELMAKLGDIRLDRSQILFALTLFAVGMTKKAVFADQIAVMVDSLYKSDAPLSMAQSLMAFYGFTAQIYCDFSGYTDMAIAIAILIGIRFPRNFERPYLAASIRQFWRRWHISLSRWLRDYLYKPLGGSRHGMARMVLATMLTMALGGLWHGANWTFVIWGLIHGGLVALEHLAGWAGWSPDRLPPWLGRLLTLHLVAVAWVLFRAPDLGVAGHIFSGFLRPGGWDAFVPALWPCLLTALVFILHRWDSVPAVKLLARRLPPAVTIPACAAAVATAALLAMDNPNAFIYFDF